MTTVLLREDLPINHLDEYIEAGGMRGLRKARSLNPRSIIEEVKRAGLRGRGGAGFLTGQKWESLFKDPCPVHYVCCNAAEGEPGTFKDRYLIRHNPYQLIEGLLIADTALKPERLYIGIKREYKSEIRRLNKAIQEMSRAGWADRKRIRIVEGPDDYLFGEEKAFLEVLEGNAPLPRVLPVYVEGLFRGPNSPNPTLVNNAETFCHVTHILSDGHERFRRQGTSDTPGTLVVTLDGDIQKPGIYEVAAGISLRELIEDMGEGVKPGRNIQAVFSGVSNAVLNAGDLDAPLSYEGLKSVGSGLGSCGLMVYDDTICPVRAAAELSKFLSLESCGQCIPCKRGCEGITERLMTIESGAGTQEDMEAISVFCGQIEDGRRCYLAAQENILVSSMLVKFESDFKAHIGRKCSRKRSFILPKITDYDPAKHKFTYDLNYRGKSS